MSAYILPNSILFLAILLTILIIVRHYPEATRQLEESGVANSETVRDVMKRWLLRVRGGLRSFWRFVLEGKGLRDPKGSKFRMRQLLEQNRFLGSGVTMRAKMAGTRTTQTVVDSVISASVEVNTIEVNNKAVTVVAEEARVSVRPVQTSIGVEVAPVSPKRSKRTSQGKPTAPAKSPDAAMRQAKTFIDAKDFLRARYELEQVAESFQDNPVYWARLGYVQYHLGAYREAVVCYQKSLALDSNQANRYYNLALAHEAVQEHLESLAALDQALTLDPDNVKYQQTRDALAAM